MNLWILLLADFFSERKRNTELFKNFSIFNHFHDNPAIWPQFEITFSFFGFFSIVEFFCTSFRATLANKRWTNKHLSTHLFTAWSANFLIVVDSTVLLFRVFGCLFCCRIAWQQTSNALMCTGPTSIEVEWKGTHRMRCVRLTYATISLSLYPSLFWFLDIDVDWFDAHTSTSVLTNTCATVVQSDFIWFYWGREWEKSNNVGNVQMLYWMNFYSI